MRFRVGYAATSVFCWFLIADGAGSDQDNQMGGVECPPPLLRPRRRSEPGPRVQTMPDWGSDSRSSARAKPQSNVRLLDGLAATRCFVSSVYFTHGNSYKPGLLGPTRGVAPWHYAA
jgi:hypothetical protein